MKPIRNWGLFAILVLAAASPARPDDTPAQQVATALGGNVGIVGVVDLPGKDASSVVDLLRDNPLLVLFQSDDAAQVAAVRDAAAKAGLLGVRLMVDQLDPRRIGFANNLADCVLVAPSAAEKVDTKELMRVLRPKGSAFVAGKRTIKPVPEGLDDWSHPYHGADNNPQSTDQMAQGKFNTQFIARPKFSPMPQQSVVAGGRIYKALGHIAHRTNQEAHLNTLLCINAYNGTILWKRPLQEGFMIHRNTMVATEDALYMGDHESCKVIDGRTGAVKSEITVPAEMVDGPVWKWMALQEGTLFAMIGAKEINPATVRTGRRGLGHWGWGMWEGHDYKDPKTNFGFGRTFVAIDVATKKVKWHTKLEQFLDARGVAMNKTRIFAFSPQGALFAIDRKTGEVVWKKEKGDKSLEAIGPNQRAQHYVTGYSTTCYVKCNEDYLFFSGPQRKQMAVISAKTGDLAWTHPDGNLQIVLRKDAIYAAGPKSTGVRLDYATGEKIGPLPTRRACTRATGGVDSIFYRTRGGTVRVLTQSNVATHIAAMRPPCQDGVIISNGHLYWGPWMCGCQLSLYGNIGLGPVAPSFTPQVDTYKKAHVTFGNVEAVAPLGAKPGDFPAYRANNERSDYTKATIPSGIKPLWTTKVVHGAWPTGPVTGGGLIFLADRTGAVQAIDADGKQVWKQHTAGPIYFPPAVAKDRVYVGSSDGRVYAYEAKTGRPLWTFRVAPDDQRIYVFGQLISRWPVAGGVVVQDGTLYAAAGIVNFDGTYVVALDAVTGLLKAKNTASGLLAPDVQGGISLQGTLSIVKNELRFLGGGVYETARFDLKTLKCLNEPANQVTAGYRTAFYPYYPQYGKFVSLQYRTSAGTISHAASYEGNYFGSIALQAPDRGAVIPEGEEARKVLRRRGQLTRGKRLWQDGRNRRFTAFIGTEERIVGTGHTEEAPDKPFLVSINTRDGSNVWQHALPADAVRGGLAMDAAGRIYVALENGELRCFEPAAADNSKGAAPAAPAPTETQFVFVAGKSMKPYDKGTKMGGELARQETSDPLGPFQGQGVYFQQNRGQDRTILYRVESATPVRQIRYRGAATEQMRIDVLDPAGNIIYASAGPYRKGNVYSEHAVNLPKPGQRFLLRFTNHASTWFYIEKIELK